MIFDFLSVAILAQAILPQATFAQATFAQATMSVPVVAWSNELIFVDKKACGKGETFWLKGLKEPEKKKEKTEKEEKEEILNMLKECIKHEWGKRMKSVDEDIAQKTKKSRWT